MSNSPRGRFPSPVPAGEVYGAGALVAQAMAVGAVKGVGFRLPPVRQEQKSKPAKKNT